MTAGLHMDHDENDVLYMNTTQLQVEVFRRRRQYEDVMSSVQALENSVFDLTHEQILSALSDIKNQ